jgi:AmmeMemoRadiSam system protein B
MEPLPKIRGGVEAIPAKYQGRDVIVLRDRAGISRDLALDRGSAVVLAFLDGTSSLRDIQVALMRQRGLGLVTREEIQGLVDALDRHFLLDNERYRNHLREVSGRFREESLRPATHAGSAYAEDPEALQRQIESLFQPPNGPGRPSSETGSNRSVGLIVPHIDFNRGGHCYAWGYAGLQDIRAIDLFVILGTCHLPMEQPFALTTKIFQTPLGETASDAQLAEAIAQRSGQDLFKDEIAHRAEHTIEVQVVFLQHLLGDARPYRILPILCAGFHEMVIQRVHPSSHPPYRQGLEAIREVLDGASMRKCVIASADLSHLGPQFGDAYPVSLGDLPRIERDDRAMIQSLLTGDADEFYRFILEEGDRRRICGLPPIYTLLQILRAEETRLLKYDQAHHPQATVTFASIGFWEGSPS